MRYRYLLGVKWSQVQILSARLLSARLLSARLEKKQVSDLRVASEVRRPHTPRLASDTVTGAPGRVRFAYVKALARIFRVAAVVA